MLYVARHGQTVWNAQNKVCGITDVDLTEKGIEQAKTLAYLVESQNISLILSSPLRRASVKVALSAPAFMLKGAPPPKRGLISK